MRLNAKATRARHSVSKYHIADYKCNRRWARKHISDSNWKSQKNMKERRLWKMTLDGGTKPIHCWPQTIVTATL
jgi:hypothetical protein